MISIYLPGSGRALAETVHIRKALATQLLPFRRRGVPGRHLGTEVLVSAVQVEFSACTSV
jgi:hypothetical protein